MITLPDFARFSPDKEAMKDESRENLVKTMLGWDVTDFGSDDFAHCGAVLFTVRNGNVYDQTIGVPYAEAAYMLDFMKKA